MKLIKSLAMGVLASAAIGTASAVPTTTVHVSGSSAFRAAAHKAVIDYLTTATGGAPSYCFTGNANIDKASAATFISSDGTIAVETYWSGSTAGAIDLVAQNNIATFLATTNTTSTTGTFISSGATLAPAAPVDYAFVDTKFQTAAAAVASANIAGGGATTGGATSGAALQTLIAGSGLVEAGTLGQSAAGIVTFGWYTGNTTGGSPFTNITTEQARALITSGALPLPFFTGSSVVADRSKFVYLAGRAEDSGTRASAFGNANFGVGASPKQWQLQFTNNQSTLTDPNFPSGLPTGNAGSTVSGANLWAGNLKMNTNTNISWSASAHYGYIGGGDLAKVLSSTNPVSLNIPAGPKGPGASANTAAYFVGYLGVNDGSSITNGTLLSYNGVPYTVANVQNGLYTFWSYEHTYLLPTASADVVTVANGVADAIFSGDVTYANTGVQIDGNLLVQKTADGGAVSKNY